MNRFAVPESDDVPANVMVPAVAVNDPDTERSECKVNPTFVEIDPVRFNA